MTSEAQKTPIKFEELEQARQAYLQKRKKASKITLSILAPFCAIVLFAIIYTSLNDIIAVITPSIFSVIIAAFVYIIVISICTSKELAAYKQAYKAYFVEKSFAGIFTNIRYNHLATMPKEHVRQVMTTADRYSSNDYMMATYKNINFAQADVHTEEERTSNDSNGNTRTYYVTIFRGRFFIFDFNRNFNFALQVRTKAFAGAMLPTTANQKMDFHKLETESTDFNHDFEVYGQDGVDTFYILEPAFIEKLHNLYHTIGSELAITFIDGKVYIAVNNQTDAFEAPNPKKPIDEQAEVAKVSKDIKAITDFVDALDLDNYTFKKARA